MEEKRIEIIEEIFSKTKRIIYPLWHGEENPQISHILNYLCLLSCHIKGKDEAKKFNELWDEDFQGKLKSCADTQDWINQWYMTKKHLEQALKEEGVHNPINDESKGAIFFYEKYFQKLYPEAKECFENFQKTKNDQVAAMQKHHEDVFSSHESWEAALLRGDPTALCD
jgi:hypothetical protein